MLFNHSVIRISEVFFLDALFVVVSVVAVIIVVADAVIIVVADAVVVVVVFLFDRRSNFFC